MESGGIMQQLKGKVVLVTGGAGGIGRGLVEAVVREGARVGIAEAETVSSAQNQFGSTHLGGFTRAKAFAEDLKAQGVDALAVEADVTDWEMVERMVKETKAHFGRIDIFINAAGITTEVFPTDQISIEAWDNVMNVNAKGTFLTNKAIIPVLREQGGGKIINISSITGKTGGQFLAHYAASKGAVLAFSNSLAQALAQENITVNCICPGIVATQMWKLIGNQLAGGGDADAARRNVIEMTVPMKVEITPEDLGKAVIFLCVSDHVTRQSICVDGGVAY
jgi:meso-butanediol dehydrogenase / (S,S)-butanediol dehydrogenase / diacetyl reductase